MTQDAILKNLMDVIKSVNQYQIILTKLFDKYILEGANTNDFDNFNEQFAYTFNVNPMIWAEYFSTNKDVPLESLKLNTTQYNAVYNLLYQIKSLYGAKYLRLTMQEKDPFLLIGINVNIKNNETNHLIKFVRGDMSYLDCSFTAESLLLMMPTMQQAIGQVLDSGLFNLNETTAANYLISSKDLSKKIEDLLLKKIEVETHVESGE